MPPDTCKAKNYDDAGRPKGRSHNHGEGGSETATGSKMSIRETSSRSNQSHNLGNSIHKSNKRLRSVNEVAIDVDQRQIKKRLPVHHYLDRFRAQATKVKPSEGVKLQAPSKVPVSGMEGLVSETMNSGDVRESTVSMQQKEKDADRMLVQEGFDKETESKKSKCINAIKSSLRQLLDRQLNEKEELQKHWRAKKAKLEKHYQLESMVIHSIYMNSREAIKIDKLKILEDNHRKKLDELDSELKSAREGMEARHQTEIEEEEKEGIRKMNEWIGNGLFGKLPSKEGFLVEEVVPVKSSSLEEENAHVHRSAELHNDTSENSGSVEVAAVPIMCDNGAIATSPNAIQSNNEATPFGNHAESTVAAEEVEQIATSKNDQLSTENPTLQTETVANEVSERDPAARTEQNKEAGCFIQMEPMSSPCTMNLSVAQPVMDRHQLDILPVPQENAISSARSFQLNSADVRAETSGIQSEMIQDIMPSLAHTESTVAAEGVEQIATRKNDQPSMENPTLQTEADANEASKGDPAARTEHNKEAGCVIHIEPMNSPCTMNLSVAQPVTDQHQLDSLPVPQENAISSARSFQLNSEDVRTETSGIQNERIQDIMPSLGHTESTVAAEGVEQIATRKNDQLSTENPTLQTEADANEASERDPAARIEQNEEVGHFTHIESMNSPCSMNSSVFQAVMNQNQVDSLPVPKENAVSSARSSQLNNEDVHAETPGIHNEMIQDMIPSPVQSDPIAGNTSDQALHCPAVPLNTGVSCSTSFDVPGNQPMTESSLPPEIPIQFQENARRLNRWVEATPQLPSLDGSLYDSRLHNQSQFDSYMASRSILPSVVSQESDPLEREFERISAESNQVSKNREDMVGRLKSECEKEIEKLVGEIRSKYESRFQEAEASFIEKKKEMDRYQWKVGMNVKLAEAFRGKMH